MLDEASIIIHKIHLCFIFGKCLLTASPHIGCVQEAQLKNQPLKKTMISVKDFLKTTTAITVSDISQEGTARIANIADGKGKPIKIVLSKECTLRTHGQSHLLMEVPGAHWILS